MTIPEIIEHCNGDCAGCEVKKECKEALLPICRECRDNVIFAQEDLEKSILQEVDK